MRHGLSSGRDSALWGNGSKGSDEHRSHCTAARWTRGLLLALLVAATLSLPALGHAAAPKVAAPPDTTITSGPANGSTQTSASATFTYASDQRGVTFECSLDNAPFKACASSGLTLSRLWPPAPHTFAVRATTKAGLTDATPATVGWHVLPWISTANYAPRTLLNRARADPYGIFRVIVETSNRTLLNALANFASSGQNGGKLKRTFSSIAAINAKLPGWAVLYLAENQALFGSVTVTEDKPVSLADYTPVQQWQKTVKAERLWSHGAVACEIDPATGLQTDAACVALEAYTAPTAPAIAVVDSGIDVTKAADFGARVIHTEAMSTLAPGVFSDGNGHGTFVASIAAGAASLYPGTAPTSNLVSIRVMNDQGEALTSDVIAAADWILANKDTYNIRVANFSLHTGRANSFKFDPLDHAVERLWFAGVTVVAAAGNFGVDANTPTKMYFAPGNDPFVITVGASDAKDTADVTDDDVTPWSAFGRTADGFAKPEVVAPGRLLIGAIPDGSTIATSRADHIVAPGYIRISGTSFSSPAVAGIAANLLALHPAWGPDQVKGALMQTAHPLAVPNTLADGAGEVDAAAAADLQDPVNPNTALDRFVVADSSSAGGLSFDAAAWQATASSDVGWADIGWADLGWADIGWADAYADSLGWADASHADSATADLGWADSANAD